MGAARGFDGRVVGISSGGSGPDTSAAIDNATCLQPLSDGDNVLMHLSLAVLRQRECHDRVHREPC